MDESISRKKCVFVLGPTATGKSRWALEQAERHGGSVVNIDSIQFYKGLEIGSAAPTAADRARVPHYLYSYVAPPEEMTAARFLEDFYTLVKTDLRFPLFITGGTGFYIQALEKGMYDVAPVPEQVRLELEEEFDRRGADAMHDELLRADPESKIHRNDRFRIVRALEIIRHTGKRPSELKQEQDKNKNKFAFPYIKLGFDFEKEVLRRRVHERTRLMLRDGIVDETRNILDTGFVDWAPLQSVGIRETVQMINEGKDTSWLTSARACSSFAPSRFRTPENALGFGLSNTPVPSDLTKHIDADCSMLERIESSMLTTSVVSKCGINDASKSSGSISLYRRWIAATLSCSSFSSAT